MTWTMNDIQEYLYQYRWILVALISIWYIYIFKFRRNKRSGIWDDEMNQIIPYLYLTSYFVANNEQELANNNIYNILAVISTDVKRKNTPQHITYMHLPLDDTGSADIKSLFSISNDFIDNSRKQKKNVVVHCMAGVSRSPSIIMAYLIAKEGFSLPQAFEHIRKRREIIQPNYGFMRQLMEYEQQLTGRLSDDFFANYVYDGIYLESKVNRKEFISMLKKHNYDISKASQEIIQNEILNDEALDETSKKNK